MLSSIVKMFIHLRYRDIGGIQEEVLIFHREGVNVSDVLERMMLQLHILYSTLKLYNEHGRLLKNREMVEKARVYTLWRKPKQAICMNIIAQAAARYPPFRYSI